MSEPTYSPSAVWQIGWVRTEPSGNALGIHVRRISYPTAGVPLIFTVLMAVLFETLN